MKLSRMVKIRLLICMLVAFFVSNVANLWIQARSAWAKADRILMQSIDNFESQTEYNLEYDLVKIVYYISDILSVNENTAFKDEMLEIMLDEYFAIYDISVINPEGTVMKNTKREDDSFPIKRDMKAEKSFLEKLKEEGEYATFHEHPFSSEEVYAGVILEDGNYLQLVIPEEILLSFLPWYLEDATESTRIGLDGNLVIINDDGLVISSNQPELRGKKLEEMPFYIALTEKWDGDSEYDQYFRFFMNDSIYYGAYKLYHGNYLIAIQSQSEVLQDTFVSSILIVLSELFIFAVLLLVIHNFVKKQIVQKVDEVNEALTEITIGKKDTIVSVRGNLEFESLSNGINSMVSSLKAYAENEKRMLEKDLKIARQIQMSALPGVFPPFPMRMEIDLFASIYPAKEVGGDFYDFFLVKEDTLVILIADVSSKGIPAALFMMIAKATIKNLAENGLPVDEVMNQANQQLYEENASRMFVTVWMGYLNLKTGQLTYVNAGHNKPFLCHGKEGYLPLKERSGIAAALKGGVVYKKFETNLSEGDRLFLYTDGITEANNEQDEMYSEKRLGEFLNRLTTDSAEEICLQVNTEVERFAAGMEQFDDMTMVALTYHETDHWIKR